MKIGLISPKGNFVYSNSPFQTFWESSRITETYRTYWTGLSSGLLVIASLTPSSYEVEIIDENIDTINFSHHFDLVGISLMTQQATRAYQIADTYRKNGVPVILGGIHATVMPNEAKYHADSVVIGEVEPLWKTILEDFKNNSLQSFYSTNVEYDLKMAPIPRYDLLCPYNSKVIWIQTTRGCPHNCDFCAASNVYGKKYRTKSVDQIITEICFVKRYFPRALIGFSDDNLFADSSFAYSFLNALIPLKIRWMSQTDISIAKKKNLLRLIQKSGCAHLLIGFESLSNKNFHSLDKNKWKSAQLINYSQYINTIQSYGIGILGAFIIGLEFDDLETVKSISDFSKVNHLYSLQTSILTPFPGTALRKRLEIENRILPTSWNNYTGFDVNFIHQSLKKEQLEEGLLSIYKSFYNNEVYSGNIAFFKNIQKTLIISNQI